MSVIEFAPAPQTFDPQTLAADPRASVFVTANAGSGKTSTLVDRVARALLAGSRPEAMLCVTYTKAAAAEMQRRLFETLGDWAVADDDALAARLARLEGRAAASFDAERLARARRLFARALETPGGLKIQTIHAFCETLLRRFPLEAGVSPGFEVLEDAAAAEVSARARDAVALEARDAPDGPVAAAYAHFAVELDYASFEGLFAAFEARREAIAAYAAACAARGLTVAEDVWRVCGFHEPNDPEALEAEAAGACAWAQWSDAVEHLLASGPQDQELANKLAGVVECARSTGHSFDQCWAVFSTAKGQPSKKLGAKALDPSIRDWLAAEQARLHEACGRVQAARVARDSVHALTLATAYETLYRLEKARTGRLDFDDLIAATEVLLTERADAAWVLYKLDGGIDHVLVDEAQDTSPGQWAILRALTGEFFVGAGAPRRLPPASGGAPRTVFAVGDEKQSIYSFQGADPAEFHRWRERFRARVEGGGELWREPALTVSFRSVEPVLRLVDAVFSDPDAARGLVEPGQGPLLPHRAARVGLPGRVELWPLTPAAEQVAQPGPWQAPSRNAGQDSAPQRLAEALAGWIAGQIGAPDAQGSAPLRAGDVLVLVPRRSGFVRALIRALKSEDVPVATLVRTGLVDQVAVQDLVALCDALLLPMDDLTVGCVLTSPLGGLSDDALMELATTRGGASLWDSLRDRHRHRPDWASAWSFLSTLFARVDYASPYALLGEALGALGGRARLLARLGPEAAEPVDELLSAAQRYEDGHPPSLQGFLHWLRNSEETIKREPDSAGDAVRVMTVHGAKGLQARLVVIPDTTAAPRPDDKLLWTRDPITGASLPFWVPRSELASNPTRRLGVAARRASIEEQNRLLYVALTRASDRLLVCGWQPGRAMPEGAWYELCRRGFEAAGAVSVPSGLGWEGERLVIEDASAQAPATAPGRAVAAREKLPEWLGRAPHWRATPPPVEPPLPSPLAPSRPDDVAFGPLPAARSPLHRAAGAGQGRDLALARGRVVHALLQHLPALPPGERAAAAHRFAARPSHGLPPAQAAALAKQALSVLDDPQLAGLFGPGSRAEQPLAGLADGVVVSGQVDRLLVGPSYVLLCDFKTGRASPDGPDQVPVLYLRQMAAYRALLRGLYPSREIRCLLVWTEGPSVMTLPDALLDMHRPEVRPALEHD